MNKNVELRDEELNDIVGGKITYTWDGTVGTIGMNGYNPYILLDKDKYLEYQRTEGGAKSDAEILTYLLQNGIAKKK